MCGIAGAVWSRPELAVTKPVLQQMTDVIRHRGPDDDGHEFFSQDEQSGAALGFRRLSIIDLAGGHQPLSNEDGSVWVIFNGEIYNYRELRGPLEARGHQFRTHSDTEVIVHAYEEEGPECVQRFRGMFGFAIWDQRRRRLMLARDRLGQKPIVYRLQPGRLSFASEIKSLLQLPGAPRDIDPRSIAEYLTFQYVPQPRTIFRDYHKLPPAHYAVYEQDRLTLTRYWRPPYDDPLPGGRTEHDRQAAIEQLRAAVDDSVRLRMRSDVPIGAFLSGGVDSTITAGVMARLSPHPIHTFSIGFQEATFDERVYARQAAEKFGSIHHEYVVDPSAATLLPDLLWHYDEPFADSSAVPTMQVSRVARQEVTVALSGDGGDELFGGYDRYRAVELAARVDFLPRPLRRVFAWNLWQHLPAGQDLRSFGRRLRRFMAALGEEPEHRYLRWIGIFDDASRQSLLSDEFLAQLGVHDPNRPLFDAFADCRQRDFVTRTMCADVLTYLPGDILTKVDIASMAASLECRSPFLDHPVAELAARLPIEWKRAGGEGKVILKDAFADLIPPDIRQRPKMGFGVPINHWFRHELNGLLRDALLGDRARQRGYFRMSEVERLVTEHSTGKVDHRYRLWSLLILELWHQTFVDGPIPQGPRAVL